MKIQRAVGSSHLSGVAKNGTCALGHAYKWKWILCVFSTLNRFKSKRRTVWLSQVWTLQPRFSSHPPSCFRRALWRRWMAVIALSIEFTVLFNPHRLKEAQELDAMLYSQCEPSLSILHTHTHRYSRYCLPLRFRSSLHHVLFNQ